MIKEIKKILMKFIKTDSFFVLLLFLIFLIYSFSFWSQFLKVSDFFSVGGWDGSNHFAIANVYAQEIFPKLFGWTFSWNTGMVFPLGYPPGSYFFLGFLNWLLPFKFIFIFKFLVLFLIVFLILAAYFLPRKLCLDKWESFFSSLIFTFFMLTPFSFGTSGLSFLASFRSGLYSQLFAGVLLVLWLFFFLNATKKIKSFFWSVILLFLILITNIHIGEAALIIWFSFLIGDFFLFKKNNLIKIYSWNFLFSFLLLSLWSFPLLNNLDYFLNFTFQPSIFLSFLQFPVFIFLSFSFLGFIFAILKKNRNFINLGLSGLGLMFFAFLPVNLVFKSLPLQPQRLLAVIIIVFAPVAVFGLRFFYVFLKKYFRIEFWILGITLIFPWLVNTDIINSNLNFPNTLYSSKQVLSDLKNKEDGRSTVEVFNYDFPEHHDMAAMLPFESNHQTIWNVFRESTLNSPFVMPLRNTFSISPESYGVSCCLCGDSEFLGLSDKSNLDKQVERAKLYGLKYFVVRHDSTFDSMFKDNNFKLVKIFNDLIGRWSIFSLKDDVSYAESLEFEPALIYTNLETKYRDCDGMGAYNWLRLSESWFKNAEFETVLAKDKNNLFEASDLDNFKIAVFLDYNYSNLDDSFNVLKDYLDKGNYLFLFSDDNTLDPLVEKLKLLDYENLMIKQKTGDVTADFEVLFSFLSDNKIEINKRKIENIFMRKGEIKIKLSEGENKEKTNELNKIYIKSSYFPMWESGADNSIYLASPALTLVFSHDDEIDLKFNDTPDSFRLGFLVSILAFFSLILIYFKPKIIGFKSKK